MDGGVEGCEHPLAYILAVRSCWLLCRFRPPGCVCCSGLIRMNNADNSLMHSVFTLNQVSTANATQEENLVICPQIGAYLVHITQNY